MVHLLRDLCDEAKAIDAEMRSLIHQLEDPLEADELLSLGRDEWIYLEERNDDLRQVTPVEHRVDHEVFPVVVRPSIPVDLPAPEIRQQELERTRASLPLNNCELRLNLPAQSQLRTAEHR